MQYSTNSNEALRWLIHEKPTIAGAYRQARLQLEDRLAALAQHEINRKKLLTQIELKELEKADAIADGSPKAVLRARLIELDIEEIKLGLESSDRLIADAVREADFCRAQICMLCEEVDFESLPAEEFNRLMDQDFIEGQYRWFAAQILGPQLGIPIEATERILQLPEAEQSQFIKAYERKTQKLLQNLGLRAEQHIPPLNHAAF